MSAPDTFEYDHVRRGQGVCVNEESLTPPDAQIKIFIDMAQNIDADMQRALIMLAYKAYAVYSRDDDAGKLANMITKSLDETFGACARAHIRTRR